MPRTKQTVRRAPAPTDTEVSQALVVASISFTHTLAPPTPVLSPRRCRFLCDWMLRASGAHDFSKPVPWQTLGLDDYPLFVQHPMDIGTSRAMIQDDNFDFGAFLDRMRLIWANACRYNPPSLTLHHTSRRLAALFDEKVIELQAHHEDDDPTKLLQVYAPLLSALETRDESPAFLYPVNFEEERSYPHIISVPTALADVRAMLEAELYANRRDIEADIELIWSNARTYCGPNHWITAAADVLASLAQRLLAERTADVDRPYMIISAQRMQLHDNLVALLPTDRLAVMKRVGDLCADAITDVGDGTSVLCIDSLSFKHFMAIDVMTRQLLAAAPKTVERDYQVAM